MKQTFKKLPCQQNPNLLLNNNASHSSEGSSVILSTVSPLTQALQRAYSTFNLVLSPFFVSTSRYLVIFKPNSVLEHSPSKQEWKMKLFLLFHFISLWTSEFFISSLQLTILWLHADLLFLSLALFMKFVAFPVLLPGSETVIPVLQSNLERVPQFNYTMML